MNYCSLNEAWGINSDSVEPDNKKDSNKPEIVKSQNRIENFKNNNTFLQSYKIDSNDEDNLLSSIDDTTINNINEEDSEIDYIQSLKEENKKLKKIIYNLKNKSNNDKNIFKNIFLDNNRENLVIILFGIMIVLIVHIILKSK